MTHLQNIVPLNQKLITDLKDVKMPSVPIKVLKVDLQKLKQHKDNLNFYGPADVRTDLKESITKLKYIIQPVITNENKEILVGTRLVKAAIALGYQTVDVAVMSNLTEDQQTEVILNSNLHHSKSSAHIAKELQSLTAIIAKQGNIDGKTRDEVSKRTGIATGNISKYKQILESERAEELFNRIDLPSDHPDNLSLNGAYQEVKQPKQPTDQPPFDISNGTATKLPENNQAANKTQTTPAENDTADEGTPTAPPEKIHEVINELTSEQQDESEYHLEVCPQCKRPYKP